MNARTPIALLPHVVVPAAAMLAVGLLGAALPASLAAEPPAMVQQGAKLMGAGESGEGRFGRSVALSADGDTALIGAPHDAAEAGAAWVFTRSGSQWTQQGVKLAAPEFPEAMRESGPGHFGRGVALSADGDTALIGAPNDDEGHGAVWIFTRSGSTWSAQAKLTGGEEASGSPWFGRSVALSADGGTALVGGFVDHGDTGAAWVFTRSGTNWTQQGPKLTAAGEGAAGELGWSVALSADGGTALLGAPEDGGAAGAAWVFTRSNGEWQQGAKLTGGGETAEGEFGESVALAADGATALIGGTEDGAGGAAWAFTRAGAQWTEQGAKLTGAGEAGPGYFGESVALSANGAKALIGGLGDNEGVGAAWLFARSGSSWTQQGEKLLGGEEQGKGQFGWSVALSGEGDTALIGGLDDNEQAGAAWAFVTPPPSEPAPPSEPQSKGDESSGPGPTQNGPSLAGSTGAAKGGVAAFRSASGRALLVGRRLPVKRGHATIVLRCVAPVQCSGVLTLTVRTKSKAATPTFRRAARARARFSIPPHQVTAVRLGFDAATEARMRLALEGRRAARRGVSALLAVLESAPGQPQQRTYVVRLVAQRAHRTRRRRPAPFGRVSAARIDTVGL